jgi:preprotein translocase subunit SecA
MNQQRQVVYAKRRALLQEEGKVDFIEDVIGEIAHQHVKKYSPEATGEKDWQLDTFIEDCKAEFLQVDLSKADLQFEINVASLTDLVQEKVMDSYRKKEAMVGSEVMRKVETFVYMQIIDQAWKDHLLRMDQLKDSVGLRGYAQKDPLQEYKKEAYNLFESMMIRIEDETTLALVRMPPPENAPTRPTGIDVDDERIEMSHPDAHAPSSSQTSGVSAQKRDTVIGDGAAIHRTGRGEASRKPQQSATPVVRDTPKVGRNDDCPCGSGKKYKKCHGKQASEAQES